MGHSVADCRDPGLALSSIRDKDFAGGVGFISGYPENSNLNFNAGFFNEFQANFSSESIINLR